MNDASAIRGNRWLTKFFEWFSWNLPACKCERPRWHVLLEYYPSFTKDYWECRRCGRAQVFNHDDPPVRIKTAICNLGHVHIINGK